MLINNNMPYTDYHGLNLDWLIAKMKELDEKFDTKIVEEIEKAMARLFIDAQYDASTETLSLLIDVQEV